MLLRTVLAVMLLAPFAFAADKYDGPVPPKPDVPYLVHADNLIETEVAQAREDRKNDSTFVMSGQRRPRARLWPSRSFCWTPKKSRPSVWSYTGSK